MLTIAPKPFACSSCRHCTSGGAGEKIHTQNRMGSFPLRQQNNLHLGNLSQHAPFFLPQNSAKVGRFNGSKQHFRSSLKGVWKASRLQEANVKLKSCLSCESERLEMALKTQKPNILKKDNMSQKTQNNGCHKKLFHHDGMIWFWSAIFFLERLLCSFNWSGLRGSGSMWIPKELMQPSHTSDITHRAFQLYPGNLSEGTGWNMHTTWRQNEVIGIVFYSVTSLDFGKTFRSKQLRRTPSPFIEINKLSTNKNILNHTTILWYPNLPGLLAIDHRLWKKISQTQSKFPDVSEMVRSAKTFLAGMVSSRA